MFREGMIIPLVIKAWASRGQGSTGFPACLHMKGESLSTNYNLEVTLGPKSLNSLKFIDRNSLKSPEVPLVHAFTSSADLLGILGWPRILLSLNSKDGDGPAQVVRLRRINTWLEGGGVFSNSQLDQPTEPPSFSLFSMKLSTIFVAAMGCVASTTVAALPQNAALIDPALLPAAIFFNPYVRFHPTSRLVVLSSHLIACFSPALSFGISLHFILINEF